jgi:hypothetical protein
MHHEYSGVPAVPSSDNPLGILIGKTITQVEISQDNTFMRFMDSNGVLYPFMAIGDCCSNSWFHEVTGIEQLLDSPVQLVTSLQTYTEEERASSGPDDVTLVYGINLVTLKGIAKIVFRNISNGYYCGWIEYIEVYSNNYKNQIWRVIEEDMDGV